MSSTWRKTKESFKENTHQTNASENFSNIPMFDVLHNKNRNDIEQNNSNEKSIIEGFDWEGQDYYHHHGVYNVPFDSSKIKEFFETLLSYISSPVSTLDSMIENAIYNMLIASFMINNKACSNKINNIKINIKIDDFFFWSKKRIEEDFSLKDQSYLIKTLDSFKKNHPDFIVDNDTKLKVGSLYIKTLNSYETKLHRRITSDELFLFNNDFDNLLNNSKIQQQIMNSKISDNLQTEPESPPLYENTENDYKKYYETYARFKIANTDKITYFKFNEIYFISSDMKNFDDELNNAENENNMLVYSKFLNSNINLKSQQSPPQEQSQQPDSNYIFSIDKTSNTETTIENYLTYVIKYFSLIVFSNLINDDIGFQEIEARVGTVYTNLLNRVEFLQYNSNNDYLDKNRIAIFNHIFFILIQQYEDTSTYSINNNNKYYKLVEGDTSNYIKLHNVFTTIIQQNNEKYPLIKDTSKDNYNITINENNFPSMNLDVGTEKWNDNKNSIIITVEIPSSSELIPFIDDNKHDNYINDSLFNYILKSSYKSKEMENYFIPDKLSECDKSKRSVKKEFKNYARIIKNELYRILFIPVAVYIIYNIYYMFFFRDVKGKVKEENGKYINTNSEGCKNPLFPDWETYFHSYENNNTNILFEFIFKPAKIVYTYLNAFKAVIRTCPGIGIDSGYIPPYIYLFFSLYIFLYGYIYYKERIISFYNEFFNDFYNTFINQDVTLSNMSKFATVPVTFLDFCKYNAMTITNIFFGLVCVKDILGLNWYEWCQLFAVSKDNEIYNEIKEERSWVQFLISPPNTIFFIILKIIGAVLYWVFKYYVSYMLIPFSIFIAIIYFTYMIFFAIYNNTNNETSYFDKKELIDRIIYTHLYKKPVDIDEKNKSMWKSMYDNVLRVFKWVCWIIMIFMTELLAIWFLQQGFVNITKNINGTSKYANGLKLCLTIFYAIIVGFIGLWCVYKYKINIPMMKEYYSDNKEENTQPDKRYTYTTCNDKNIMDKYEFYSENKVTRIIFGSDILNKILLKEDIRDKETSNKSSSLTNTWSNAIIGNMGKFGDKILQKGQNIFNTMRDNSEGKPNLTNEIFGNIDLEKSSKIFTSTMGDIKSHINNMGIKL